MMAGYADLLVILAGLLCMQDIYAVSLALFDGCLCKLLFSMLAGYAGFFARLCCLCWLALLVKYVAFATCIYWPYLLPNLALISGYANYTLLSMIIRLSVNADFRG
jgi:hypothetical protein